MQTLTAGKTKAFVQVLLFSTMTRVLDVLEDYLDWRGYHHLRLDGAVSSGERGDLVRRFNDPSESLCSSHQYQHRLLSAASTSHEKHAPMHAHVLL